LRVSLQETAAETEIKLKFDSVNVTRIASQTADVLVKMLNQVQQDLASIAATSDSLAARTREGIIVGLEETRATAKRVRWLTGSLARKLDAIRTGK
jgi:hypothetical protein